MLFAALTVGLTVKGQVTGRVTALDGNPVAAAEVSLTKDSVTVAAAATDSEGRFSVKAPDGEYVLRVGHLGYKRVAIKTNVRGPVSIGEIVLSEESVQVDSITVVASNPVVSSEAGKLTLSVGGTYLARMPDIGNVINQMPGVSAAGESVNVLGRGTPLILIDGRPIMSEMEYRALRPDQIASITLDRMPSAIYESEYRAVIDIRTKRRLSGLNLRNDLYAGRRLSDEAYIQATQKFRSTTLWAGFNPRWRKNRNRYESTETMYLPKGTFSNIYDESLTDRRDSYRVNAGIMQEFSGKHTLKASYGYFHTDNRLRYHTVGTYGSPEGEDPVPFSVHRSDRNTEHWHQGSLRYDAKFNERISLGITADYLGKRLADRTLIDETSGTEENPAPLLTDRRFRGKYNVATGRAEMKAETRRGYELLVGGKYAYISNNSRSQTSGARSERTLDIMKESNWAVYAQAGKTYGIATVEAAVRGAWYDKSYTQDGKPLVEKRDFKLLPSLSLGLNFGPAFSLSLAGNIKLRQPGFQELNPMIYYTNSRSYYQGNPGLRPTLLRGLQAEAVLFGIFGITAEMTDYKDLILDIYEPDRTDNSVLRNTPVNLPRARDWAVSLMCYKSFRKWGFSLYGRIAFPDTKIPFTEGELHYTEPFYSAQASCWAQPAEFLTVYANFSYAGKSRDKTTVSSETYDLSAGIQFSLVKSRLFVTVYADDILNRAWGPVTVTYGSVRYGERPDMDSRKIGVSLNFILERQRVEHRWDKSNEEEAGRL